MNAPTDDDRIRQHADLVYRTCLRITGNAQDAADVAQEVFVAWLRQHREITGSVAAWLYGTARQRSLDWLRTNHRRQKHEQQVESSTGTTVPEEDWRGHLDAALNELPEQARTLVVEHHLLGLTQGQLAARYRCTQATISRRLTQTLELLRAALRSRGVTASGAVLIGGFTAARANACPTPLVAPVLAQAQVVGTTALVGPSVIAGFGLLGWISIAAGILVLLAMVGGVGLWWWSAQMAQTLDRDWTAVATAHLPPPDPSAIAAVRVPAMGPRYPSIEALIAHQPVLPAERQARLERLTTKADGSAWAWMEAWPTTASASLATALQKDEPLNAADEAIISRWRERFAPIMGELRAGGLSLGTGAALGRAYAAGRLGSAERRNEWLRSQLGVVQPTSRVVLSILLHDARVAPDRRAALADVDAWVAACTRSAITLYEAMLAQALWDQRDRFYQELAWRGQLPEDVLERWLAEPCEANAVMSDGLLGDALLLQLPQLDDLRAGRASDRSLLARLDYLVQGRDLTWLAQHLEVIQGVLGGQDGARFRALAAEEKPFGWIPSYWPTIAMETNLAAISESHHRAYRLAVEVLRRTRLGEPLPKTLAISTTGVANAWGLRYERLSPTRFALCLDPDGVLPCASLPEQVAQMRGEVKEARSKPRTRPLVQQHLLIEMETTPSATPLPPVPPGDEPVPFDEPPPLFPTVAQ